MVRLRSATAPMRIRLIFLPLFAALALAGCDSPASDEAGADAEGSAESEAPEAGGSDAEGATEEAELTPLEIGEATPMAERIATIGLLNKRNNVSQDFEMRPGESIEDGPVILTLAACERTAPFEFPQETGAFVQVDVQERGDDEHTRVFSGWLFKENPSLNIVEHPAYDVWVKDCAMAFPGDE